MAGGEPSGTRIDGLAIGSTRTVSPPRQRFLTILGRKSWPLLHGLSDRWPCRRCRPSFSVWMSGLHDAVNVRIGRSPFRPEAWDEFRAGRLDGAFHRACMACRIARWASRMIAQVPKPRSSR